MDNLKCHPHVRWEPPKCRDLLRPAMWAWKKVTGSTHLTIYVGYWYREILAEFALN